jgi:hypothetical protein
MCNPVLRSNWKPPFVLMVDRGGCTFVQKVRNAQHAGAAAVIIADNKCQCVHEKTCTPDADPNADDGEALCEKKEPIMADDGSGLDITIPSVLLFKQDADPIKDALIQKHTVRIELTWSLPNPNGLVEWDLWTSPTDKVSKQFKNEFKTAVEAFGDSAKFTPHMYIYDGIASQCQNSEGKNECFTMCTNEGRYCALDPDMDMYSGITGADIVAESARRICIWELYGEDGIGLQWWNYGEAFSANCDTREDFMKEECVQAVMMGADIDYDRVEQCVFEAGGLETSEEVTILQAQLDEKESKGIIIMPVVYVNGVAIRGELEFATVFKAICAGYAPGTEPDICDRCANCPDEKKCVLSGSCPAPQGTIKTSTFAGSLFALSIIFFVVGAALYYRQQQQMEEQVKGMIKEYMPLDVNNAQVADTSIEQEEGDAKGTYT